jgi:hypothetical protein
MDMTRNDPGAFLLGFLGGVLGGAAASAVLARRSAAAPDWASFSPLVNALAGEHEALHLRKLAVGQPFPFVRDQTTSFFEAELRRLRSHGYIECLPAKSIETLLDQGGDVRDHVRITPLGRQYLELRDRVNGERLISY